MHASHFWILINKIPKNGLDGVYKNQFFDCPIFYDFLRTKCNKNPILFR